jgi:hypothetical protein
MLNAFPFSSEIIGAMGNFLVSAYMLLIGTIAWSALRHRRDGWKAGLLFGLMLATLPAWVGAMTWLFERVR